MAETGVLMAEAGGRPSAVAGGRELAEAAGLAEAGLVAEAEVVTEVTKEVSMVAALVSTNSPADAPRRRHYKAWDGRVGCTGHSGALPTGRERPPPPKVGRRHTP